jgi:exosortase
MKRNQVSVFGLLFAASLVFWWHSLVATARLALSNEAYTHILLILPVSVGLIYLDSQQWRSESWLPTTSTRGLAAGLLIVAFGLGWYARWGSVTDIDLRLTVGIFSLVTWWLASVIFCFGIGAFRSFVFPLCFLFLLVPIPGQGLIGIVEFLQLQSAFAARIMFRAIGIHAGQDGIMLYIPGLDIEVARECSSIRSSLMLVVTTLVVAHLFLRSWWRKISLVVLAIPLSVAKNGLRIVTIGALGTRVDPGFLDGNLHHRGGVVFFGVAVFVMVGLLWILRRSETRTGGDSDAALPG